MIWRFCLFALFKIGYFVVSFNKKTLRKLVIDNAMLIEVGIVITNPDEIRFIEVLMCTTPTLLLLWCIAIDKTLFIYGKRYMFIYVSGNNNSKNL